jgi:hypothetical protein
MPHGRSKNLILAVLPALIAGLIVFLEPVLTTWVKDREAVLPLTVFVLLSALLHPRLRSQLMLALCYGVAFLALRDSIRDHQLPPDLDYLWVAELRPLAQIAVAALSATAALAETFYPGTVWARRCYFGAASLYFTGLGITTYFWQASWQSAMFISIGVTALYGCIFAPNFMEMETEEETDDAPTDVEVQQALDLSHHHALQKKEWRDDLVVVDNSEREASARVNTSTPSTAPH